MERNGRFTFGWCISYRPFHNPPRKEVEAKIVKLAHIQMALEKIMQSV